MIGIGLIGKKCGMTQFFHDEGSVISVSVIHIETNTVTQIKTVKKDGYSAVQVTTGITKRSRLNKPQNGHFSKSRVIPGYGLWEFRLRKSSDYLSDKLGMTLKADLFKKGQYVDVSGITKGKGFSGPIKRHNFSMQDATHGNSLSHRAHGSTGQNQTPGRVFKGKKMAGQMGNVKRTVQNLKIIEVNLLQNVLIIKGGIPGPSGSKIVISPSIKKNRVKF